MVFSAFLRVDRRRVSSARGARARRPARIQTFTVERTHAMTHFNAPKESDVQPESSYASEKKALLGLAGLLVLILTGFLVWKNFGWLPDAILQAFGRAVKKEAMRHSPDAIRGAAFTYLAQPDVAGPDVEGQLLGQMKFVALAGDVAYFAALGGEASPERLQAAAPFLVDPKRMTVAHEENGLLVLDGLRVVKSANAQIIFKTPLANVKFNPKTELTYRFQRGAYVMTLAEIADLLADRNVRSASQESALWNDGQRADCTRRIATASEPTFRRFVGMLTADAPAEAAGRERRIQRVTDFVSQEIQNESPKESFGAGGRNFIRRPNEILMTHDAAGGEKAALLGTLLEQLEEDYLIVYPRAANPVVAVREGNFPNKNGLTFVWNDETWTILDPFVAGFIAGETEYDQKTADYVTVKFGRNESYLVPSRFALLKDIAYIQRPRMKDLSDVRTGRRPAFVAGR
jgi:hypothetical protein